MRDESDLREIRAELVSKLEDVEGTEAGDKVKWAKLEAAETALDYALGDNDVLENVLDDL